MVQQFTKNIFLEELIEGQDRSDLTANFTFRLVDIFLHSSAVDKRNTPPVSPVTYSPYIVGDAPTGAWVDFGPDNMTYWDGVAWKEVFNGNGTVVYNRALDEGYLAGDLETIPVHQITWVSKWGTVSATMSEYTCAPSRAATIDKLVLVSSTATTSDGSNDWTFQLHNRTAANTLFATPPTTNGADFAADTAKVLTPDQNQAIAASDVLELVATLTLAPGDLTQFHVQVEGHYNY